MRVYVPNSARILGSKIYKISDVKLCKRYFGWRRLLCAEKELKGFSFKSHFPELCVYVLRWSWCRFLYIFLTSRHMLYGIREISGILRWLGWWQQALNMYS